MFVSANESAGSPQMTRHRGWTIWQTDVFQELVNQHIWWNHSTNYLESDARSVARPVARPVGNNNHAWLGETWLQKQHGSTWSGRFGCGLWDDVRKVGVRLGILLHIHVFENQIQQSLWLEVLVEANIKNLRYVLFDNNFIYRQLLALYLSTFVLSSRLFLYTMYMFSSSPHLYIPMLYYVENLRRKYIFVLFTLISSTMFVNISVNQLLSSCRYDLIILIGPQIATNPRVNTLAVLSFSVPRPLRKRQYK